MRQVPAGLVSLSAVLLLAGCTNGSTHPTAAQLPTGPARTPTGCGDEVAGSAGGVEVQAATASGSLYGLIFGPYPVRPGNGTTKIAWRMTGTGPLVLLATGPGGESLGPSFGPEPHAGSNWVRPGEEWGSGFDFTSPGCWTIEAIRNTESANIKILVAI